MIDLHTHSLFSDGSLSPSDLVCRATQRGITTLAITDHDTFAGCDEGVKAAVHFGLRLIRGIEITARHDEHSTHLLGYFIAGDPGAEFRTWVSHLQQIREARNRRMLDKLVAHGCDMSLRELPSFGVLGRVHFAKLLVSKGYAASLDDAFAMYLGESAPCYEQGISPSLEESVRRVSSAGGLAVLAHPGRYPSLDRTLESVLPKLVACGLQGIEVFHSEHSESQVLRYRDLAGRYHLAMTGGSDFHGDAKPLIDLGSGISGRLEVPDALLSELDQFDKRRRCKKQHLVSVVLIPDIPIHAQTDVQVRLGAKELPARVRRLRPELDVADRAALDAGSLFCLDLDINDAELAASTPACTQVEVFSSDGSRTVAHGLTLGPACNRNGCVVWLTGLSGAGKTTIAEAVQARLRAVGMATGVIDGDVIRRHLSRGLGYDRLGRDENIRRIAFIASAMEKQGLFVVVSAISPYRCGREGARKQSMRFIEVYVNAPLETCEARDVKGLYRRVRAGEIDDFTGITSPYEPPLEADVECRTDRETVGESAEKIIKKLLELDILRDQHE